MVLSSSSDHFDRLLKDGWEVFNITRESEEDLKYFKRLLELSYTGSYTRENDSVLLNRETRLGIATIAGEFQYERAIDQLITSLREELTFERQILCLEREIPARPWKRCWAVMLYKHIERRRPITS